ncbi:MAG: LPS export ABC transporter protein LptC [Crocinitomicaceae bacterium]|jgi:LPS export ABC transporter protein LptC
MKHYKSTLFYWIPVILLAGILFSCVNDLDTIQKVTYDPKAPDEVATNLEVYFTDSGYARVRIFADLAETFHKPEHLIKLKDHVVVEFYSEKGEIISRLEAKYGEVNQETGLMMVRDSVVLRNLKKKQYMETEELFYNQKDSTVYTEKFVTIKKEGKGVIGSGKGIKTSHFFDAGNVKGDILHPVGKLDFSED